MDGGPVDPVHPLAPLNGYVHPGRTWKRTFMHHFTVSGVSLGFSREGGSPKKCPVEHFFERRNEV